MITQNKALWLRTSFVLTLCLLVSSCGKAAPTMAQIQAKKDIQAMMQNAKTHCVGRYTFQLPEGFELVSGLEKLGWFTVTHEIADPSKFDAVVAERRKKIAEKAARKKDTWTMEEQKFNGKQAVLFKSGGKLFNESILNLEGLVQVDGIRYIFRAVSGEEYIKEHRELLTHILTSLRSRSEHEVPTEPGLCMPDAFLPGMWPDVDDLYVQGYFRSEQLKDIHIEFTENSVDIDGELNLLQRFDKAVAESTEKELIAKSVKSLRKGKRTAMGREGLEHIVRFEQPGAVSHQMTWETLGKPYYSNVPTVNLNIITGYDEHGNQTLPTSIGEEKAVELFDAIINSIKPFGTDGAKKTKETTRAPLGELAATGRACPQTGWWQCSEGGEVAGAKRQHFKAGERMPKAVLLGEPSVWQKLKNERPMHEMATVWKLVDYDAELAIAKAEEATPPPTDLAPIAPPENDEDAPPPTKA